MILKPEIQCVGCREEYQISEGIDKTKTDGHLLMTNISYVLKLPVTEINRSHKNTELQFDSL